MDITAESGTGGETPAGVRRRSMAVLFAGVALMNTAMVGASTAGTLIVAEDDDGTAWSGLPNAAGVLGTALGALAAGALTARRGGRAASLTLYRLAAFGALLAFAGAVTETLAGLLAGMVLLGLGNGAAQLSRYAAAELYPEGRKGFGLSLIVWAGTVGALAGPALIAPAGALAEWWGLPELSGPILVSVLVTAGAAAGSAVLPRAADARGAAPPGGRSRSMAATVIGRPALRTPMAAMVAAQVAMVAVMTMTPPQLHAHGHGLEVVGWVLSAHMIGMFALAPVSGRIADRLGGAATIACGIGTLAVATATAAAAPTAHVFGLPFALFLLGYGWNLVIVAGSRLLTDALAPAERARGQGVADAFVWSASAVGSLFAGLLFGAGGYPLVAVVAGALAVAALVPLARRA